MGRHCGAGRARYCSRVRRWIQLLDPHDQQKVGSHGALLIQLGPDEFLIAGTGVTVTFAPAEGAVHAGIESIWEGRLDRGQ